MVATLGVAFTGAMPDVAREGCERACVDHRQVGDDHDSDNCCVLGGADNAAGSAKHTYLSSDFGRAVLRIIAKQQVLMLSNFDTFDNHIPHRLLYMLVIQSTYNV